MRPKVICIETRSFGENDYDSRTSLTSYMENKSYKLVGLTPINCIFVDSNITQ